MKLKIWDQARLYSDNMSQGSKETIPGDWHDQEYPVYDARCNLAMRQHLSDFPDDS